MGHIFSPEKIHEIGRRATGLPFPEMVRRIIDDLDAAYPGHIEAKEDWLFSIVAGATGVMTVLHASLSEYVIIFGSAVGTEGFSGRYAVEIFDCVTAGEMWTYTDDNVGERVITRPGELAHLARDRVKGFRIHENTWMLEYGRGIIPTALPIAVGDSVFSAMDFYTVAKTFWNYGKLTLRELRQGKI